MGGGPLAAGESGGKPSRPGHGLFRRLEPLLDQSAGHLIF